MGNKYLDKVVGSLIRGTKIDYEKERIYFSFFPLRNLFSFSYFISSLYPFPPYYPLLSSYCKDTFGLTEEEIEYVYLRYVEIIIDKVEDGQ